MNEPNIVEALLRHDPFVTRLFFYRNCRPLLLALMERAAEKGTHWEYDELVSELYALLLTDDGRRLRQWDGRSTLYQWLKIVAMRMMDARKGSVIENQSREPLYNTEGDADDDTDEVHPIDSSSHQEQARQDVERLLALMRNERYVTVLRLLVLEEREPEEVALQLGISVANLYNIKRRAMLQLIEVAHSDVSKYKN